MERCISPPSITGRSCSSLRNVLLFILNRPIGILLSMSHPAHLLGSKSFSQVLLSLTSIPVPLTGLLPCGSSSFHPRWHPYTLWPVACGLVDLQRIARTRALGILQPTPPDLNLEDMPASLPAAPTVTDFGKLPLWRSQPVATETPAL